MDSALKLLFPSTRLQHPIESRFELDSKLDKIVSNCSIVFQLPPIYSSSPPTGDKK